MTPLPQTQEPSRQPHRWSRREYEDMIAGGVFDPEERVELLDGEILQMSPQSSRHATAVQLVAEALRAALAPSCHLRTQLPLALGERSEPEPDVAVVKGAARDYRDHHPQSAVLVVEVADTSLTYDRGPQLAVYASAGIAEYWILDLTARQLEVHRQPGAESYAQVDRLEAGRQVEVPSNRDAAVAVADLLP